MVNSPPVEKKSLDPSLEPSASPAIERERERGARHVYAKSAAFCANWSQTRHNEATVTIDVAAALADGGYDWKQKFQFQLAPGELAEITASLFHPGVSLRLVHHSSAVKTLTVLYQAPNVLISLAQGPRVLRVPVRPADQFMLRNFLLARLAHAQGLPPAVVLRSLEVLAAQMPPLSPG